MVGPNQPTNPQNQPGQNQPGQNQPGQNTPAQNQPANQQNQSSNPFMDFLGNNKFGIGLLLVALLAGGGLGLGFLGTALLAIAGFALGSTMGDGEGVVRQGFSPQTNNQGNQQTQNQPGQNTPAQNQPGQNQPGQNNSSQTQSGQTPPVQNQPAANAPTQLTQQQREAIHRSVTAFSQTQAGRVAIASARNIPGQQQRSSTIGSQYLAWVFNGNQGNADDRRLITTAPASLSPAIIAAISTELNGLITGTGQTQQSPGTTPTQPQTQPQPQTQTQTQTAQLTQEQTTVIQRNVALFSQSEAGRNALRSVQNVTNPQARDNMLLRQFGSWYTFGRDQVHDRSQMVMLGTSPAAIALARNELNQMASGTGQYQQAPTQTQPQPAPNTPATPISRTPVPPSNNRPVQTAPEQQPVPGQPSVQRNNGPQATPTIPSSGNAPPRTFTLMRAPTTPQAPVIPPAPQAPVLRPEPVNQTEAGDRTIDRHADRAPAHNANAPRANDAGNDPADVRNFDLPRNRPIGYLAFSGMGNTDDRRRFGFFADYQRAMPELLDRCGYDMVCADNNNRLTYLQENPKQVMESHIAHLYRRGVRDFYISLDAHGSEGGTHFSWTDEHGRNHNSFMSSNDFRDIVSRYHDCTFAFDTESCHAGGLIGMMRNFRDRSTAPEGRVAVFTHTREDTVNYGWTYFDTLAHELRDMADGTRGAPRTYGEAHFRSDSNTRNQGTTTIRRPLLPDRVLPMRDPVFWRSRPGNSSIQTTQMDNPLHNADAYVRSDGGYQPTETDLNGVQMPLTPNSPGFRSDERQV